MFIPSSASKSGSGSDDFGCRVIAHFDFDSDPDFDSDFSTQYDLCNLISEKL